MRDVAEIKMLLPSVLGIKRREAVLCLGMHLSLSPLLA